MVGLLNIGLQINLPPPQPPSPPVIQQQQDFPPLPTAAEPVVVYGNQAPPDMGWIPATPLFVGANVNELIMNALRGMLPQNINVVNEVREAFQSFFIYNDGLIWHCTACQAEVDNQYFLYRMNHVIGLEDSIYKPDCPRCGNQFSILKPFQTCGSCLQVYIANRSSILEGLVFNVGTSYIGLIR